jgi:hypothetical protein
MAGEMAGEMSMGPDGANVFTDRVHEADWPRPTGRPRHERTGVRRGGVATAS